MKERPTSKHNECIRAYRNPVGSPYVRKPLSPTERRFSHIAQLLRYLGTQPTKQRHEKREELKAENETRNYRRSEGKCTLRRQLKIIRRQIQNTVCANDGKKITKQIIVEKQEMKNRETKRDKNEDKLMPNQMESSKNVCDLK